MIRMTNGIMVNNSLYNINNNKILVDKLNTQLASKKKIQRPSEDPIIAIRALRFRSTLSEIEQYLDNNIPDARSWLRLTEDALGNCSGLLEDVIAYYDQAANGTNETLDRQAIVQTMQAYRDQMYNDANADYAGRTIFTGYKTNNTLTFEANAPTASYEITENFDKSDIETVTKIVGAVDATTVSYIAKADQPDTVEAYRVRLAYADLEPTAAGTVTLTTTNPAGTYAARVIPPGTVNDYQPGPNDVYFDQTTGELVLGTNVKADLESAESFSVTYQKTGFDKGELKPEHYFDCTDNVSGIVYTAHEQLINYNVNFNQTLQVNTQGKDVFTHAMTRDIDDTVAAVEQVMHVEQKIKDIEKMLADPQYKDPTNQERLNSMLEAANKELDLAENEMQKNFEHGLTLFQNHQTNLSLKIADIGARGVRLTLNESRLKDQQLNIETLKNDNEDINYPETATELVEAESVYDASLMAASKVVKNSLLDFI